MQKIINFWVRFHKTPHPHCSGARRAEIRSLNWAHFTERPKGDAKVSIFGKGGKRKEVVISVSTWSAVKKLRLAETTPLDPVFTCKYDGGLRRMSETMFYRVVVKAAIRAGVRKKVSPHFLRHSHATHALNRGAGLKLLQETLGHSSLEQTGRYLHSDPEESSGKYLGV